ncbi:Uncharacterized conserved protein, DUF2384 family [Thermomonas hydrothermalis]|uniref:Uncharacterized conserved protein, DUF2384 family n=2 Tax=Thermomonas hydrothermalis TaxID=213588 RepID=A0A1M4U022_9GAMM|nr:Uncharacterized conserved protein, DUF2384 family [Thermomonas hydrothermalis]
MKGKPIKAAMAPRTSVYSYRQMLRQATPMERVKLERRGVPAEIIKVLLTEFGMTTGAVQKLAGIPKSTYTKKIREKAPFAGTPGQSVIGLLDLVNMVEDMLKDMPDMAVPPGFSAEKWVAEWVERPQPALGGVAPIDIMDTPTGRASVMKLLGSLQSGAYQ